VGRGRRAQHQRPSEPLRRCVGCRTQKPQREIFRLAALEGEAVPGKGKPGRGCWICFDPACAEKAVKGGQIARAFKGKAKAPTLERLREWIGLSRSLDGERGGGLKS
jgi:predicted RNA-binding protein YlxR (DUF448 family)